MLRPRARGIGKAAELIDLTRHTGAHPRMGATDVVPFIPIEGVTLEDCVRWRGSSGRRSGSDTRSPSTSTKRRRYGRSGTNLENIRRGQFEGIREEMTTMQSRKPDVGEARVHPTAGAIVIGARKFLVAYNVYLNTPDVSIAKKMAKAVRFCNGGLRYVKGMGVEVRGLAQVSMNLTDTDQTPIARVFEFVKREAARYGVMPLSSEIVGLIPKKALEDAAEWFLQVENFDSSLILENRLAAVTSGKMAVGGLRAGVEPFMEQLAAPTAAPGGGSASAAAGAMAAALAAMVAGMSRGKKAYLQHEAVHSEALARLATLREELKADIDADTEAFNQVMAAYKAAKQKDDGAAGVRAALQQATLVPLGVAERAAEAGRIADALRAITNPNMASDLKTAIALARASVQGAAANVDINLDSLEGAAQTFLADVRQRLGVVLEAESRNFAGA